MKKQITELALFLCMVLAGHTQTKSENLFYMIDTPKSFESFKAHVDQISIVCPQAFFISEEGVISGSVDKRILKIAKANNIKVMPLIVNKGFNQQSVIKK